TELCTARDAHPPTARQRHRDAQRERIGEPTPRIRELEWQLEHRRPDADDERSDLLREIVDVRIARSGTPERVRPSARIEGVRPWAWARGVVAVLHGLARMQGAPRL